MSFPRYPAYKPSGVEWLGEVPEHWTLAPLKKLLDIQNGSDYKAVETEDGYPVIGSGGPFAFASQYHYEGESVLLGRKGTIDRPLYVRERFWAVVTMYWSKIRDGAHGRFAFYTSQCIPFQYYSTNTALPSMTKSLLGSHIVAVPCETEQGAIATFLDHETAKIDALIAEQQRLIELLQEKRQAVISHAVTKGLNPDAPMKDSGVEWLGEVPEHWDVAPLKHHWLVTDCKHVTAEFTQEGYPLASIKEAQGRWIDLTNAKRTTDEFYKLLTEGSRTPEPGDLVFTRNATVGEVAEVPAQIESFALGQDVVILKKLKDSHCSSFAWHLLRSTAVSNQLECAMIGSTFRRINVEQIKAISVPIPPSHEQASIAIYLEEVSDQWSKQEQDARHCVSLLQERRSALISAAVTGQIDVRGLVPVAEAA
jgi:type I restriction enzyme, S subunit